MAASASAHSHSSARPKGGASRKKAAAELVPCPEGRGCSKRTDQAHMLLFTHPCRMGLACRDEGVEHRRYYTHERLSEEVTLPRCKSKNCTNKLKQHLASFSHPCRQGADCTVTARKHREQMYHPEITCAGCGFVGVERGHDRCADCRVSAAMRPLDAIIENLVWLERAAFTGATLSPDVVFSRAADLADLALRRPTTQSSTLGDYNSGLAVNGAAPRTVFTHTLANTNTPATWSVELAAPSCVHSVRMHNRYDCASRLRDITVRLFSATGERVSTSQLLNPENAMDSPPLIIHLLDPPVIASRVEIVRTPDPDLSGTQGEGNGDEPDVLSLSKVEVIGTPAYFDLDSVPLSALTRDECIFLSIWRVGRGLAPIGALPPFSLIREFAALSREAWLAGGSTLQLRADVLCGGLQIDGPTHALVTPFFAARNELAQARAGQVRKLLQTEIAVARQTAEFETSLFFAENDPINCVLYSDNRLTPGRVLAHFVVSPACSVLNVARLCAVYKYGISDALRPGLDMLSVPETAGKAPDSVRLVAERQPPSLGLDTTLLEIRDVVAREYLTVQGPLRLVYRLGLSADDGALVISPQRVKFGQTE